MPPLDYRRLREQITMEQVLELVGFQVRGRRGPQLRGPCPIPGCQTSSPHTFSVHLGQQVYRCFACDSCGNALDLWAAVCRLPLHQAALALCQATHLTPPWLSRSLQNSAPRRSPVPFRAPSRNR